MRIKKIVIIILIIAKINSKKRILNNLKLTVWTLYKTGGVLRKEKQRRNKIKIR